MSSFRRLMCSRIRSGKTVRCHQSKWLVREQTASSPQDAFLNGRSEINSMKGRCNGTEAKGRLHSPGRLRRAGPSSSRKNCSFESTPPGQGSGGKNPRTLSDSRTAAFQLISVGTYSPFGHRARILLVGNHEHQNFCAAAMSDGAASSNCRR